MSRCNLCGSDGLEPLIEFGEHPIAHRFLDAPDHDEYTHPVTLGFCPACGLSQLLDPIPPKRLYTQYNWLSSWKPNPHLPQLLTAVAELPGVSADSKVLEVGSNDGSFLEQLRERGFIDVIGLEPAADACAAAAARGVRTIQAYFTPETARAVTETLGRADVLVARHVLEHVVDLAQFAEAMRIVLRPGAHVLVEVPDFDFSQAAPDYSAVWEEHVNHFTRITLGRFLRTAGVEVERFETYPFSGQALAAFGRVRRDGAESAPGPAPAELREQAYAYRDRWPGFEAALGGYLEAQRRDGRRVAVYGAGCRAATLINFCDLGRYVDVVVDDQAEKQGKYMPGSRLPVVAGDVLEDGSLDLCLLAVNAENEEAVIGRHRGFLDRGGEFASLHPPSPRLPRFWTAI